MNKKSGLTGLIVTLSAFAMVALVLLFFGSALAGQLKEDVEIEVCRASVLAQAQTKMAGKSIAPLDCPRRNLKIYEDKVELDRKKSNEYEFKKLSQDDVNHILAEELRSCWYKMLEGKSNVLEQSYFFSDSQYYQCLICAEIDFDDKLRGRSYTGLLDYLKSKDIPNEKIKYFDYLIRSQKEIFVYLPYEQQYSPFSEGTTGKIYGDQINTNEKYTIYFLAMKPTWFVEKTGGYVSVYYIGLGKEDKLRNECQILVN